MQLKVVEYPERRLDFFKEQLAAAHRRLDWSMKHNPNWDDHAEKGEVVSFYEWAVQMAEKASICCKNCKYSREPDEYEKKYVADGVLFCTNEDAHDSWWYPMWGGDSCSYGERKDGEG